MEFLTNDKLGDCRCSRYDRFEHGTDCPDDGFDFKLVLV